MKRARAMNKKKKKNQRRRLIVARIRSALVATASGMVLLTAVLDSQSFANPLGPSASDPGVTYSGLGTNTTGIGLDKSHTIINWQSFNVGQGQTTDFYFGANNWIVLNRVNQGSATINGNLNGCLNAGCTLFGGNVWVYASDGVLIGPGARVNAGGFLATTSPLASDSTFLSPGNSDSNVFDFGASVPDAAVTVKSGAQINANNGTVALIAPQVTTEAGSSVNAGNGTVLYGAAQSYRVKFAQDSADDLDLVDFEVPAGRAGGTDSKTPLNVGGKTTAGNVYIASVSKQSVADAVINVSGEVTATNAAKQGGDIVLSGDGDVNVSGQLTGANVSIASTGGTTTVSGSVTAEQANGAGGDITVTAPNVALASTAKLDASGTTGGTVLVGGDVHGGVNPSENFSPVRVANADTTSVAKGASILANGSAGNGGNVVVWSNQKTDFAGTISATGGGGNGGFAETSSHKVLGFTGTVDLTATGGKTGTLLLDPENLSICANPCTTNATFATGTYTATGDNSTLLNTDLQTQLGLSNVVVTTGGAGSAGAQTGDITVAAPVTWSSGNTLTLEAYHSIFVGAALTANTGSGGAVDMKVNQGGTGGVIEFDTGGSVTTTLGQTYEGPVSLTVTTGLSDSSAAGVIFDSTVDGAQTLTVTGNATFDGVVGGGTALTSVDVTGTTDINTTAISTSGNQTYTGNATLAKATNLTSTGGLVDFGGTLNGAFDLTITGKGEFDGIVGGTTALTSIDVTGTTDINTTAISTSGNQTYTGAVTLAASPTLTSTTGNIGLGTTDAKTAGSEGLTVDATAGSVSFNGTVGGTKQLTTLSATSGTTITGGAMTMSGALTLDAGTTIAITGAVSASSLSGYSHGSASLTGANAIGSLGAFNTNNGDFTLDDGALSITGALNAGSGTVNLVDTATIGESGSGAITAATLKGSSVGGTTLNSATNQITQLGNFTNTTSGEFDLTDAHALTVSGTLDNSTVAANVNLTTTGVGSNLVVTGAIDTNTSWVLGLYSAGTIDESAGTMTAGALTGTSVGGATLTGTTNHIASLYGFSNSGAGGFDFSDSISVAVAPHVSSTIDAGTGDLTITTTGSGHLISLQADLVAGASGGTQTITLNSADAISQTAGTITGGTLTGSSHGNTTLTDANAIGKLGSFATNGGNFTLNDTAALTVGGTLNVTGATLSLTDTGGGINASGATVDAATLTGSTTGGNANFTGGTNAIGAVSGFTVNTSGNFYLNDTTALSITGDIVVPGNIYLQSADTTTGITFNPTSPPLHITAGGSGLISIQSDKTVFSGATVVSAGTLEFAPNTLGKIQHVKGVPANLSYTANLVRIGAVTLPGAGSPTTTAGEIDIEANTDFGTAALELDTIISGGSTGNIVFGGTVNAASLLANAAGTIELNSTTVTTTGTQEYNGAVSLGAGNTLQGSTVTFDSTVNGGNTLAITGNAVFDNVVGGGTALTSLSVTGTTTINTSGITTSGTQHYGQKVTLGHDTTVTGTTVTFSGAVDPAAAYALTVAGNAVFDGAVSGLSALTVNGTTDINGGSISTSGAQDYKDNVTLTANADLTGSSITFEKKVDAQTAGGESLTTHGPTSFDGAVGSTNALSALAVNGTTAINTTAISTIGGQTYNGAVTLGANVDLTGSLVWFKSTLDDALANTHDLTVSGNAEFDGAVGTTALHSLHVTGTSAINTSAITTSTTQAYDGAVTLGIAGLATLTGTTATFGSTVNATTSGTQSLKVAGNAVFGGIVGATKLGSLEVTGTTAINTTAISTTANQTYDGGVTLGANANLTGSLVWFKSTLDDALANTHDLTVTGNARFDGTVGTTALHSLHVTGTSAINAASITTSAAQTYDGAVTLGANANLTGSLVWFKSTLDDALANTHDLTVKIGR